MLPSDVSSRCPLALPTPHPVTRLALGPQFRHVTKSTAPKVFCFPHSTHCDARKSPRMCIYENCRVSFVFLHKDLKPYFSFGFTTHFSLLSAHFSCPFFSNSCALFHFSYPATPLFARPPWRATHTESARCISTIPNLELATPHLPRRLPPFALPANGAKLRDEHP